MVNQNEQLTIYNRNETVILLRALINPINLEGMRKFLGVISLLSPQLITALQGIPKEIPNCLVICASQCSDPLLKIGTSYVYENNLLPH